MELQNISCKYLKINSPVLASIYASGQLSSVKLEAKFNDDDKVEKVITVAGLGRSWYADIEFDASVKIKQLYIRNIYTDQRFPLLTQEYSVIESQITAMKLAVTNKLATDFLITGVTQQHQWANANLLTYAITGLPDGMVMDSVVTTVSGYESYEPFSFVEGDEYIVSNNAIFLLPKFFGKTEYENAIIHLKLTITTNVTNIAWEETCFFMDCNMRQNLLNNISVDQCKEADIHLLMLHYALTQASNFDCDCFEMYEIFDYLNNNIQIDKRTPCGC